MIFKAIRPVIHSDLELIVEGEHIFYVDCNDPIFDKYNSYEVIGIRAEDDIVVVSLKDTARKAIPVKTNSYKKANAEVVSQAKAR